MNSEKDFLTDPIFKDLRKFASGKMSSENIPVELLTAFREAKVKKARKKLTNRLIVSALFASAALPSLAAANILPKPVSKIVNKFTSVITAPVRFIATVVSGESGQTDSTSEPQVPGTRPAIEPDQQMQTSKVTPSLQPIPSPENDAHEPLQDSGESLNDPKNFDENNEEGFEQSDQMRNETESGSESNGSEGSKTEAKESSSTPSVGETGEESKNSKSGGSEKSDD